MSPKARGISSGFFLKLSQEERCVWKAHDFTHVSHSPHYLFVFLGQPDRQTHTERDCIERKGGRLHQPARSKSGCWTHVVRRGDDLLDDGLGVGLERARYDDESDEG